MPRGWGAQGEIKPKKQKAGWGAETKKKTAKGTTDKRDGDEGEIWEGTKRVGFFGSKR